MLSTVHRILKMCPKLTQINIRWAREKCLNHLKQEGVYDVVEWYGDVGSGGGGGGGGKEEEEEEGRGKMMERKPKTLMVLERGIPLIGKPFSRRYKIHFSGGVSRKWSLVRERRGRWRWGMKNNRIVSCGGGGGDVDEEGEVSMDMGRMVENVESEMVESENELDIDTEVDVGGDRDIHQDEYEEGEEENMNSTKGKEVKRIELPPSTSV